MLDEDLGAMLARIMRRIMDAERPLLEVHDLSMWGYVVLSRLAQGDADTQLELARNIGYDKTRLIGLLDELEAEGLIARTPDPADRRARIVSLTEAGTVRHATARRDIRAMENDLLRGLPEREQSRLRATLARLADH